VWSILERKEDAAMKNNEENKADKIVSRIFNDDPLLRSYLELTRPQTEALTEEDKRENFIKAIVDACNTNQEK
jgi:hypothetical protein